MLELERQKHRAKYKDRSILKAANFSNKTNQDKAKQNKTFKVRRTLRDVISNSK